MAPVKGESTVVGDFATVTLFKKYTGESYDDFVIGTDKVWLLQKGGNIVSFK